MLTPADFLDATKWLSFATLGLAAFTALAFVAGWGFRFRLVGITGFTGVLTVGLLGLSFQPFSRAQIEGAIPYTAVYDSGAAQVVIRVPGSIDALTLSATLEQAASDQLRSGRLGPPGTVPTIRARTLVHPEPGQTQLLYLGQAMKTQDGLEIEVFDDQLAALAESRS